MPEVVGNRPLITATRLGQHTGAAAVGVLHVARQLGPHGAAAVGVGVVGDLRSNAAQVPGVHQQGGGQPLILAAPIQVLVLS